MGSSHSAFKIKTNASTTPPLQIPSETKERSRATFATNRPLPLRPLPPRPLTNRNTRRATTTTTRHLHLHLRRRTNNLPRTSILRIHIHIPDIPPIASHPPLSLPRTDRRPPRRRRPQDIAVPAHSRARRRSHIGIGGGAAGAAGPRRTRPGGDGGGRGGRRAGCARAHAGRAVRLGGACNFFPSHFRKKRNLVCAELRSVMIDMYNIDILGCCD